MTRNTSVLASLLAFTTLATGCASAPTAATAPSASTAVDCRQLSAEIAGAEEAKRAALDKQKGAWKVIIPFAVAARYASGKSAAEKAEKRLADMHAEFTRQGCSRDAV